MLGFLSFLVILVFWCLNTENRMYGNCVGVFWGVRLGFSFCLFRTKSSAYGGSQDSSQIRAVTASLRHSHGNTRSKPHPQPKLQFAATLDL